MTRLVAKCLLSLSILLGFQGSLLAHAHNNAGKAHLDRAHTLTLVIKSATPGTKKEKHNVELSLFEVEEEDDKSESLKFSGSVGFQPSVHYASFRFQSIKKGLSTDRPHTFHKRYILHQVFRI